jgi:hypothetical protein
MRGAPRLSLRGARALTDSAGQTTTEYALVLVMFVGVMLFLHESVKDVVLNWFAQLVKHLSGPGV